MKILCLGDEIIDHYFHCRATRLCPEACAPVLHIERVHHERGGAALVAACLESLGGNEILKCFGSLSHKHRFFADRTLVCRIDRDKEHVKNEKEYWEELSPLAEKADAIIVSDYGKGAMAGRNGYCVENFGKPLFIDAKHDLWKYKSGFAVFPNENEHKNGDFKRFDHVVRKMGEKGCVLDGRVIPTEPQQVYDVTGAGDVFLAGFVWQWSKAQDLTESAIVANKLAGVSVRHLGTYIVSPKDVVS